MKLNAENIEEQILLFVDGELPPGQEKELLLFLEQQPKFQELLTQYSATKIQDDTVVFKGKKDLLQPERKKGLLILWKPAMVAAAGLALLCVLFFWYRGGNNPVKQSQTLVNRGTVSYKINGKKSVARVQKQYLRPKSMPLKRRVAVVDNRNKNKPAHIYKQHSEIASIPYLDAVSIKQHSVIPDLKINIAAVLVKPVVAQILPKMATQEQDKKLEKQQQLVQVHFQASSGLQDMLNEIQDKKEYVLNGWQQLKKSSVVLQFGNKEIVFTSHKKYTGKH